MNLISTCRITTKITRPPLASTNATVRRKGPVVTSKQIAGYFTVSGIENELSIPCFALKELADNAYDWLNDYYPISNVSNRHRSNSTSIITATAI
jgi:hypothetical protein